ncbi:MAG: DNA mismatch repair protein MutS, partial [Cyanobacteriota bacterium]|nr:DNA mismatch repair protein MutS [Cyanobacteriota bacterium]
MKYTASTKTKTKAKEPDQSLPPNADYDKIDINKLSEMMKRYVEVKQQYPHALLLFRVGDFFECFFQDAVTIAQELELVQTSKHAGKQIGKVPMTGVPHHALEKYAAMLVEKGFAVVVCDQVEDAKIALKENRQVKREIVRILTPGTLTDDGMLKPRYNNYLAAVAIAKNHWGLAFTDVSTGEFLTTQSDKLEQLTQELMRLQPSEILYPTNAPDIGTMLRPGEHSAELPECLPNCFCYSFRPQFPFTQAEARERLLEKFKLSSLEGLGCENLTLGVRAAGGLLEYLEDTQKQNQVPLQRLHTYTISDYLVLDHQSRRNLEIAQTVRDGSFHGSLLWAIDKTCTAMGGRALRRWLLQPLLGLKGIRSRHDTIEELLENMELRQDIQQLLRQIYDLERLAGRAGAGTANARDLVFLADSMAKLPDLAALASRGRSPYVKVLQKMPSMVEELAEKIHSHLVESPPQYLKEGGLIRPGVNAHLDEMRQLAQDDLEWVQNLEATERERTGISNLKVGYNKAFGYYISISKSKTDLAPPEYTRKQTLTNEERYITEELKEREVRILNAREDLNQLEYDLFVSLREEVGERAEEIRNISKTVAAIDVLCGLAEIASDRDYCRPRMVDSRELTIIQGRHPVVEKSLPA